MKIRSFLILACMIVVPLTAMFSHRIPSGFRAAVATVVRDLAGRREAPSVDQPRSEGVSEGEVRTAAQSRLSPESGHDTSGGVTQASEAAWPDPSPSVVPVAAVTPDTDVLGRLHQLGAVAVVCRPLDARGGHVASCRLPVDGGGQLERVFRATGADPAAATGNLLRDVAAWRGRVMSPTVPPPPARPGTMRF